MKIILALSFLLTGCASIVSTMTDGHPNRKTLIVPPKSEVITLARKEYAASGIAEIPRGAGPLRSNSGRIEKDGQVIAVVRAGFNWWTLGNLLPYNGVIIGTGIDLIGGGAFNPHVVYIDPPTSVK